MSQYGFRKEYPPEFYLPFFTAAKFHLYTEGPVQVSPNQRQTFLSITDHALTTLAQDTAWVGRALREQSMELGKLQPKLKESLESWHIILYDSRKGKEYGYPEYLEGDFDYDYDKSMIYSLREDGSNQLSINLSHYYDEATRRIHTDIGHQRRLFWPTFINHELGHGLHDNTIALLNDFAGIGELQQVFLDEFLPYWLAEGFAGSRETCWRHQNNMWYPGVMPINYPSLLDIYRKGVEIKPLLVDIAMMTYNSMPKTLIDCGLNFNEIGVLGELLFTSVCALRIGLNPQQYADMWLALGSENGLSIDDIRSGSALDIYYHQKDINLFSLWGEELGRMMVQQSNINRQLTPAIDEMIATFPANFNLVSKRLRLDHLYGQVMITYLEELAGRQIGEVINYAEALFQATALNSQKYRLDKSSTPLLYPLESVDQDLTWLEQEYFYPL